MGQGAALAQQDSGSCTSSCKSSCLPWGLQKALDIAWRQGPHWDSHTSWFPFMLGWGRQDLRLGVPTGVGQGSSLMGEPRLYLYTYHHSLEKKHYHLSREAGEPTSATWECLPACPCDQPGPRGPVSYCTHSSYSLSYQGEGSFDLIPGMVAPEADGCQAMVW